MVVFKRKTFFIFTFVQITVNTVLQYIAYENVRDNQIEHIVTHKIAVKHIISTYIKVKGLIF